MKLASVRTPRGYFWLCDGAKGFEWGSDEFRKALDDAFDRIEMSGMRLKLSRIHLEPEYGELLAACTRDISELTSIDLARNYRDTLATLFITSPGQVTPYHVDSEVNFLIQLAGTKVVYIFDGNDRELLPWRELEEYHHGTRRIELRQEFQSRGVPYELRPGLGVHNPVNFPHWVQNGALPSISLAVSYMRPKNDSLDVLRMNRYLRRFGIEPTPPGKSVIVDSAKRAIIHTGRSLKSMLRPSSTHAEGY